MPKTENSELETSEFSLRFTRTAIFFNYLIKLRGFPTPSFPFCTTLKTENLGSLIRRRWRKLRGFHLPVFHFECSAEWKSRSWKTSEFDQSTSEFDETTTEQISEVFNSDFSVLGIVFRHTNETYLKLTSVESFMSSGSRLERG